MSVTNRLATTTLQSGEDTAVVTLTPAGENVVLRLTTVAVVSPCQMRLTVRDASGRNVGSLVCQDGDDKRLRIDEFNSGDLTFQVECNLGSGTVTVDELTDLDAVLPEGSGSSAPQLETDDIPAGGVTLPKVDFSSLKFLRFDGRNGAGAITLTGAAVGDRVLALIGVTTATGAMVVGTIPTQFEGTISVVNQIQQALAGDLSGNDYVALLAPAVA